MTVNGVQFNSDLLPPEEYLMRRSYNPADEQIPGAVVREVCCITHGKECNDVGCQEGVRTYSVDVPLVKKDGGRWL